MAGHAAAQEVVFALRRQIAKIEGRLAETLEAPAGEEADAMLARRRGVVMMANVATGAERFDVALGGGIPSAGLIELHTRLTRDAGPVSGLSLALAARMAGRRPVVWIATAEMLREAGRPYLPGIAAFCGIGPGHLLVAQAAKLTDVLWIAEEAAGLDAIGAILLELRGNPAAMDLTASRRLHRRALAAGRPLLLMRHGARAEPTAAPLRLVVSPAQAGERPTLSGPLRGSIGPPVFEVLVDKNRLSPHARFLLSWDARRRIFEEKAHEPAATHTRPLASLPGDRPDLPAAAGEVLALRRRAG